MRTQDINNSGDGGVYAELIQNRAFQGDEVSASLFKPARLADTFDLDLPEDPQLVECHWRSQPVPTESDHTLICSAPYFHAGHRWQN